MVRDMTVGLKFVGFGKSAGKISIHRPLDNWMKLYNVIPLAREPLPERIMCGGQATIHCKYVCEDDETDVYETDKEGVCMIHGTFVQTVIHIDEDDEFDDDIQLDDLKKYFDYIYVMCADQLLSNEIDYLRKMENKWGYLFRAYPKL